MRALAVSVEPTEDDCRRYKRRLCTFFEEVRGHLQDPSLMGLGLLRCQVLGRGMCAPMHRAGAGIVADVCMVSMLAWLLP